MNNPFLSKDGKIKFEFEPVSDRIFVFPVPNPEKIGSIIVTEEADLLEGRENAIVIACNETYQHRATGAQMQSLVKVGDVVTYMKGEASKTILVNDVKGNIVKVKMIYQNNIIAKVKGE